MDSDIHGFYEIFKASQRELAEVYKPIIHPDSLCYRILKLEEEVEELKHKLSKYEENHGQ